MKRIVAILSLLIPLGIVSATPAYSDFSLKNCLSIENIIATVDGPNVKVVANAYQTCSEFTSPNFDGYSPAVSAAQAKVRNMEQPKVLFLHRLDT